jgi:hypothetical protein
MSGSGQKMKIPKGTATVSWNGSGDFVLNSGAAVAFPDGKVVGGSNYTVSGGKASRQQQYILIECGAKGGGMRRLTVCFMRSTAAFQHVCTHIYMCTCTHIY